MHPFNLRLGVIDCLYDCIERKEATDFFSLVVQARLQSAGPDALPVDVYDWIGTHLILGLNKGSVFVPMVGCRSVSLHRANLHKLAFPAVKVCESLSSQAAEKLLRDSARAEQAFDSFWINRIEVKQHEEALWLETFAGIYRIFAQRSSAAKRFCWQRSLDEQTVSLIAKLGYQAGDIDLPGFLELRREGVGESPTEMRWQFLWNGRLDFHGTYEEAATEKKVA